MYSIRPGRSGKHDLASLDSTTHHFDHKLRSGRRQKH